MALMHRDGDNWTHEQLWEATPHECLEFVTDRLSQGTLGHLVIEEWRLYPWEVDKQSWSDLKTSQLVGALKWTWWTHRVDQDQSITMQPASIKKPTKAQCQARGVTQRSKQDKLSIHVQDAELHAWHWILRGANPGHTTFEGVWYDSKGRQR